MNTKPSTKLISGIFAIIFVTIVIAYGVFLNNKSKTDSDSNTDTSATVTSVSSTSTPAKSSNDTTSNNQTATTTTDTSTNTTQTPATNTPQTKYRDGTYTANTTYRNPGNSAEPFNVVVSVQNDVITAVTTSTDSNEDESAEYKQLFANAISGIMVGKSLDDNSPSRVNNSSLTSAGFNAALAAIRNEAKN